MSASLVVSMFEDLRRGQRETDRRLDEGNERMGRIEIQVREQNGNVARATREIAGMKQWQADHDLRRHDEEVSAVAIAQERARIVGHVQRVKDLVGEWSVPVLLVGGMLVTLTNIAVAAFWWVR